jgi:hypothetical protein
MRKAVKTLLVNKFLGTLIWCLLCLVASSSLSHALGLSFWQPDNPFLLNLYFFQNASEHPDVVFLGSSRARFGIKPEIVEDEVFRQTGRRIRSFNLAQLWGGVRTNHLVIRDILTGDRRPDLIVLELFPMALDSNSALANNVFYQYFAGQRDIVFSRDRSLFLGPVGPRAQGFVRDASNLLWLLTENPLQSQYREHMVTIAGRQGFLPLPVQNETEQMSRSDQERMDRMQKMNISYIAWVAEQASYSIEGIADRTFRDIISLCNERGIRLVVVNMPIHPAKLKVFHYEQYLRCIDYLTYTCRDAKIRFVNLQDSDIPLDENDFWDRTHLNRIGAGTVSEHIGRNVVAPEVLQIR